MSPTRPSEASSSQPPQPKPSIINVNAENLETEINHISGFIDEFPFVSLDTEFPGALEPPPDPKKIKYDNLKENVNASKIIQLGLTLSDKNGKLPLLGDPPVPSLWQFNFSDFNVDIDKQNEESIKFLKRQGIDFQSIRKHGAPISKFAERIHGTGVLCNEYDDVTFITFSSIYDFGYLIKTLTGKDLPDSPGEFLEKVRVFFGKKVYDVKEICKDDDDLQGGLEKLGKKLQVERVGGAHQAGSDSLMTMQAYMKIVKKLGDDSKRMAMMERCAGKIYGLHLE